MSSYITKSGAGAGYFASAVSTLAALPSVETANLQDGALIYVNDVDDIYTLELVDSLTTDDFTVVPALRGGYWVSRIEGRWDDQQGDISEGDGGLALTYEEFRDTPWKIFCMRHDQNDELHFRFQFSHTWKYDTAVVPHLHVLPLADPGDTQVAYFDAYYTWSRPEYSEAVPAIADWTWVKIPLSIDPGDVYTQKLLSLGSITPPSWARGSTILLLYIRRLGTDDNDTFTSGNDHGLAQANIGLLSSDVHYRRTNTGTVAAIPT